MQSINGYGRPSHWRPTWHVQELVFRGGVPQLPVASLAGPGRVFARDTLGTFQPYVYPQAFPVVSMVGPGVTPSQPSFLTRLLGGSKQGG